MNTPPKDQTARKHQIEILELVIQQHAASIARAELDLRRMLEKQVNRLAELRCQRMLLQMQEKRSN